MELTDLRTQQIETPTSYNILNVELASLKTRLVDVEKKLVNGCFCRCSQTSGHRDTLETKKSDGYEHNCEDALVKEQSIVEIMNKGESHEVDLPDIEVTIEGAIITATGNEEIQIIQYNIEQKCPNPEFAAVEKTIVQQKQCSDVVETNCSFCDCLRVDTTKE
jgi:hypothetical protein